jgi:hypothetical protein
MGCSVSASQALRRSRYEVTHSKISTNQIVPVGVILPTTVGLESVLRQPHLRENMREFCENSWNKISTVLPEALPIICGYQKHHGKVSEACSTNYQSKHVAINCIDFWADSEDLKRIPSSTFKRCRVMNIVQKYIIHGAPHKVSYRVVVLL